MYKNGLGTEKNEQKAFECYTLASKNGYRNAMYELALFYLEGNVVEKNYNKAHDLLLKAASLGEERAKILLEKLN